MKAAKVILERRIDWVGEGLMPEGSVTALESHPGVGKSLLAAHLAACGSRAELSHKVVAAKSNNVIYVDGEHSWQAFYPRLAGAGANIGRILRLDCGAVLGDTISTIRALADDISPAVIVVDPLSALIKNANNVAEIKGCIIALREIAQNSRAAVLVLTTLSKDGEGPEEVKLLSGAARSVLRLEMYDGGGTVRLLTQTKNSSGSPRKAFEMVIEVIDT